MNTQKLMALDCTARATANHRATATIDGWQVTATINANARGLYTNWKLDGKRIAYANLRLVAPKFDAPTLRANGDGSYTPTMLDKFNADPTGANAVALAIADHRAHAGGIGDTQFTDALQSLVTEQDASILIDRLHDALALIAEYLPAGERFTGEHAQRFAHIARVALGLPK